MRPGASYWQDPPLPCLVPFHAVQSAALRTAALWLLSQQTAYNWEMHMPRMDSPSGFFLWVVGLLMFACVARIGWEIGGVLFALL